MSEVLLARAADVLGAAGVAVLSATTAHATPTVEVARADWDRAAVAVRDDADLDLVLFDHLTVVDEEDAGFDVVLRLWSPARRHGLLLRTRVPRSDPTVPTLVGVFAGAAWAEREAAEMYAVTAVGHPALLPLLLPDAARGTAPLRKEVLLQARQDTPWPGRKEPGESGEPTGRRRLLPPGVAP